MRTCTACSIPVNKWPDRARCLGASRAAVSKGTAAKTGDPRESWEMKNGNITSRNSDFVRDAAG